MSHTQADSVRQRGHQLSHSAGAQRQDNGHINIVLLGKTGVGKSSTGNTILGENRFTCERSLSAVTDVSSKENSEHNGRSVSVIDTPGFFCTDLPKEKLSMELARSVHLSVPGVHAFLFVVPYGRFTKQEEDILKRIQKVFGKDVLNHVIILFSYGDECNRENVQSEIAENKFVRRVVLKCRDYHVLNNRGLHDRQQVSELLEKIDSMVEFNQGCYTNEMYEYARRFTFKRFWKNCKNFFSPLADCLCGSTNKKTKTSMKKFKAQEYQLLNNQESP